MEPDQAVVERVEALADEVRSAQRMQLILAVVLVAAVVAVTLVLILKLRKLVRQAG